MCCCWLLSCVGVCFLFSDRPYSDATAEKMDLEARKMVDSAYQRTLDLVEDKKEQVGTRRTNLVTADCVCVQIRSHHGSAIVVILRSWYTALW